MRIKKDLHLKSILGKVICCCLAVIMMIGLSTVGTGSFFRDEQVGGGPVAAITAEDIIADYHIEPGGASSPPEIVIRRHPDLRSDYRPTVFFETGGALTNYARHINPVVLDQDWIDNLPAEGRVHRELNGGQNELHIKVEPNCNVEQLFEALWFGEGDLQDVTGTISLKYLNGFIDWPRDVTVSGSYISLVFLNGIEGDDTLEDPLEEMEMISLLAAPMGPKTEDGGLPEPVGPAAAVVEYIIRIAQYTDWPEPDFVVRGDAFGDFSLTGEQRSILDTIVPGFLDKVSSIVELLNEKLEYICRLEEDNAALRRRIFDLENENALLIENIVSLQAASRPPAETGLPPADGEEPPAGEEEPPAGDEDPDGDEDPSSDAENPPAGGEDPDGDEDPSSDAEDPPAGGEGLLSDEE